MTTDSIEAPPAAAPSIFSLDLGANGGIFSPTNGRELNEWVQRERQFWAWLDGLPGGGHRNAIDQSRAPLNNAYEAAQGSLQYESSSPESFRQHAAQVQGYLQDAYINRSLPHSSSSLGKRIEQMRQRDPLEAQAFLFPFIPSNGHQFEGRDLSSWRGFLEGMAERFGFASIPNEAFAAALSSVEELRVKAERLLDEKSRAVDALHRQYEMLDVEITSTESTHKIAFKDFIERNQKQHDDALTAHKGAMANLEKVFKENMTLRAPVEYWEGRETHHGRRATITGRWTFGSMAVLAAIIGAVAYWVLSHLTEAGQPQAWRVSVLGIFAVLGVWAVRLIVRIFLSHTHLATDAAERVTMVKTYLSLLEGDKVMSDDDRKLILQVLFRQASDGIVKDEGLPHPALSALTSLGGR